MPQIRKIEEAIELFQHMPYHIKNEHVEAIEKAAADNDVVAYLLEVLLDKELHAENFCFSKTAENNSHYGHLVNYQSFKTSLLKMKTKGIFDAKKLAFALRNTDSREQVMYRVVLQAKVELGPPVAQAISTNKNSTTIVVGNQGTVETRIEPKGALQDIEVVCMDTDIATVELLKEGKNKKVWSVNGVGEGTTTLLFSAEAEPPITKEVKVTIQAPKLDSEEEDK